MAAVLLSLRVSAVHAPSDDPLGGLLGASPLLQAHRVGAFGVGIFLATRELSVSSDGGPGMVSRLTHSSLFCQCMSDPPGAGRKCAGECCVTPPSVGVSCGSNLSRDLASCDNFMLDNCTALGSNMMLQDRLFFRRTPQVCLLVVPQRTSGSSSLARVLSLHSP